MALQSLFGNLFLAIQAKLATIPAIRHIDHEYGQLEDYNNKDGRPPVSFPCVLIDIDQATASNTSDNSQLVECSIILRIADAPHSATGQSTPASYKEKALNFYELEDTIHRALQGWEPGDDYNALIRSNVNTERREDYIRVRQVRYTTGFDDYTTAATRSKTTAAPSIADEYL